MLWPARLFPLLSRKFTETLAVEALPLKTYSSAVPAVPLVQPARSPLSPLSRRLRRLRPEVLRDQGRPAVREVLPDQ